MTNEGRQWLFRVERRLAIAYAVSFHADGGTGGTPRSEWTAVLLEAWRLVNNLRTTGRAVWLTEMENIA